MSGLLPRHAEMFERLRVPREVVSAAGIFSASDAEVSALLGQNGRSNLDGVVFPYKAPETGIPQGYRVRLDRESEGAKYLMDQWNRHLFFAPGAGKLLADASAPVVVVEAEKSCLALTAWADRNGKKLLVIAVGGCAGWLRKTRKEPQPNGGSEYVTGPSPDLDLVAWKNRTACIIFDSNAAWNRDVQRDRNKFARELLSRGASVLIPEVPALEGVNGPDDLLERHGDGAIDKLLADAHPFDASLDACELLDMPEEVLDGTLGELCRKHLLTDEARFPVAYAWPAMLAVASALAPDRFNLYAGLVGPVHSGKSCAIRATQQLLGIGPPTLMDSMCGSAEGLVASCNAGGSARLYSPDELGHLLEKAQIQRASFSYVLNRAFYDSKFSMTIAKQKALQFDARLSIVGGLTMEKFEDLFSAATTAGFYDRFIFGLCPGGYRHNYTPFETRAELKPTGFVSIDRSVWTAKAEWVSDSQELSPRVAELAIRAAAICKSFDGGGLLTSKDLEHARVFADYQTRIRRVLKPNEGENLEGKIALKILAYLDRLNGAFVSKRKMLMDLHAYRFGPSVADRALDVLHANDEIEVTQKRPFQVRRIGPGT